MTLEHYNLPLPGCVELFSIAISFPLFTVFSSWLSFYYTTTKVKRKDIERQQIEEGLKIKSNKVGIENKRVREKEKKEKEGNRERKEKREIERRKVRK